MLVANLLKSANENNNFRRVLFTLGDFQLVLMSISQIDKEIGEESHKASQFMYFTSGSGIVEIVENNEQIEFNVNEGDCIYIPSLTKHNVKNKSREHLKLFTIYNIPSHGYNEIQKRKII
jgi:mannose-6-phosphate isomerase-like protein (cupin superfamily)